jgi:hypothetical protein
MNRSLLVLALFLSAAPAYSMTATVTSATAPAAAPTASDTSATANSPTAGTKSATIGAAPDTRPGAASAAPSKPVMPNAASVTRPAAVVSAPGVPMKSNASKTSAILPSAGAVQPPPNNAAWSAAAGDSVGMHRGTLEAINVGAGTFQVFGQKLSFDAQRVKVFNADGKPGSIFALKSGANIRFTLDAADPKHRRAAVIYVN